MQSNLSPHRNAVLQALFVTFLWSTSWVLIKIGLKGDLPPLTFAGLRYTLAFLCLTPLVLLNTGHRTTLRCLSFGEWGKLALLGLVFYTLTQGTQFLSLFFLPAPMVSLMLNITPVAVALAGAIFLREQPTRWQWTGIALTMFGVGVYFLPAALPEAQLLGLLVALICVLSNAGSSLMGRYVNQQKRLSPLIVTFVSMGIGAGVLLIAGFVFQGTGTLTLANWALVLWLAAVNTALAFTLWNHTLRTLSAVESSILNGLMLPQIAVLAVVFLGDTLLPKQILGLVLVGLGAIVVQLKHLSFPLNKTRRVEMIPGALEDDGS